MECVPTAREEIDNAAEPPLNVAAPTVVGPSMSPKLPTAEAGETFTVKVTACPSTDGFAEDVTVRLRGVMNATKVGSLRRRR